MLPEPNPNRKSLELGQLTIDTNYTALSNKLTKIENNHKQLAQSINALQDNHQEYLQINQNNLIITKTELEKLHTQHRLFFEWKKVLDNEMENVEKNLQIMQQYKLNIDNIIREQQNYAMALTEIQKDHSVHKDVFIKEQAFNRNEFQNVKQKINELNDLMLQENATIGGLWNDQNIKIEMFQKNLDNIKKIIDEEKNRYTSFVFDVRAVTQVSSEASEKLEIQERTIKELTKTIKQFKLDFEVLEDNQVRNMGASNIPGVSCFFLTFRDILNKFLGYLLWKITDFSMKMENCKENNTVLKSPIFMSHPYGYKIRVIKTK